MKIKQTVIYTLVLFAAALAVCAAVNLAQREETGEEQERTESMTAFSPDREIRGVWIASVFNINYPSARDLGADALRAEIDDIVATASKNGLNTVCFQVRPSCDALYKSEIFPVSRVLSTEGVLPDGFDPLGYMTAAAHAAGIDVIAWVNPLRVTAARADNAEAAMATLSESSPARLHPEWCVFYGGQLWLDPGIPEVRALVADGVAEIVRGYDVDGVIFDDYFYPYPAEGENYDDADTYAVYGGETALADFRRGNVNQLVRGCFEAVKTASAECSFGISPFGIWRNSSTDPRGSDTSGLEAYDSLYCDALAWIRGGYIDYIAPQIYWQFSSERAPFGTLTEWWNKQLEGTGVKLAVAHGTYNSAEWGSSTEIEEQIAFAREASSYVGGMHYGYAAIKQSDADLEGQLARAYKEEILYPDVLG